jgi:AbrB family looped-hinge helix DNA binding protein
MRVTTKGQVTIPARVRDYLRIAPHSEVDFRIAGRNVVLVTSKNGRKTGGKFLALRGVLKGTLSSGQWMRETRGD